MKQALVRFYAQLNDFLPPGKRMRDTAYLFAVSGSVKDMIESLGVPHTEAELILANGQPVDFTYQVQDGDRVSVYPAFRSLDLSPLGHRQPQLACCFVADTHLGRLAAYLRMLGFDTLYRNDYGDEELAHLACGKRILLTRDVGLLMRTAVTSGYFVRAIEPRVQLAEVVQRFGLTGAMSPFSRCVHCNALLRPVDKEVVSGRLLPETREHYHEFYLCPLCERVYWKGSHYRRMQRLIESVVGSA